MACWRRKRGGVPATIVLLNNWRRRHLSAPAGARELEPEFSDFFITAHGLDFAQAAALYEMKYIRADDRASFRQAFSKSVGGPTSTMIEVRTDAVADLKRRNEIMAAVHERLKLLDVVGVTFVSRPKYKSKTRRNMCPTRLATTENRRPGKW